jgi:mycofactocin glycosyltransferase
VGGVKKLKESHNAPPASTPAGADAARVPKHMRRDDLPPFVSVVVPAYNRAAALAACLVTLFTQTYPHDRYEVIVVDDGSTDRTAEAALEAAARWDGSLRVLRKPNGGPASARNIGMHAAHGDVIAFTDSDCTADPGWLRGLVAALAAFDADGVGGPLYNVAPGGWVPDYLRACAFYRHRVRRGQVDYLVTANVAFRRAPLLAVGGFAERQGAWGEDADLSFRLRAGGYSLALAPTGAVTHHGSPMTARQLARELFRYGYGNAILSRGWQNRRSPLTELIRHTGAIALSPVLALSYVRRVGARRALACWPLVILDHGAFIGGLLAGTVRRGQGA